MTRSTRQAAPVLPTASDPRWAAVVARDAAADGSFYYAVRTTGVYCRPSCPSRLARPENVELHATREDAERAGFRPCRRCRPDDASATQRQSALVASLCRLIEGADRAPTLAVLADHAGMSPFHLQRLFKAVTGVSPGTYARACRAGRLKRELVRSPDVTSAIFEAGYGSSGRFYEDAPERLGMTPSRYRAGGTDACIRFAVGECSLGAILVACSERGVCAIALGDEPDTLVKELQDRFPRAEMVGDDPAFMQTVAAVVAFVDEPRRAVELPLDIRGTAFQERVWQALRRIPPGSTVTYSELAARLGVPQGARAVAGACAANVLAVAIPCHRVVRSDGTLSGYRWGVARKRALLDRESGR